jgi:uncharacterized protein (TIGR04551 family)
MGILANAAEGIDDDLGDSVDRLQFALLPLSTPLGKLVLVPMYEIVATGVTSLDPNNNRGLGQPFDRDAFDDARSLGIKAVHADTAEEARRKLERGETSASYGAWYQYKTQTYEFPQFVAATALPSTGGDPSESVGQPVRRDAYAHVLDLWAKWDARRFKLEVEGVGIVGQIGNATTNPAAPLGPVLLRQFGGALNAGWKFSDGRFVLGAEVGAASGDRDPGFGNRPGRGPGVCVPDNVHGGQNCPLDGAQFAPGDKTLDIRNFRFNPAYRVDLILFREILQGVTDAWYLKPQLRYELLDGLVAQAAIIYSQAMYASSTPSRVNRPLGIELDAGLSYQSDDGFIFFLNYGLLQPFGGLGYETAAGRDLSRGHAIRSGVAVKF